jgi:hypothetical protein
MKNYLVTLFAVLFFLLFLIEHAQSKPVSMNGNDAGKYLVNEIERCADRSFERWSLQDGMEHILDTLAPPVQKSLDIADSETDSTVHIFSGDKIIQETDTINGNVVVKGGSLTVYGIINGDVLVVGGDLRLKHTGKINGNPRVVNGSILKEEGALLNGYEDVVPSEKPRYRETQKTFSRSGRTFDVLWRSEQTNLDNFIFRYNRVESLFLGLGTEKKFYWDGEKVWNPYGSIGWGFKSHTWRGNLGLTHQFAFSSDKMNSIIEVGAEGYSLTDTKDQWIISQNENTAAALLIHEDFRNYFEREGYTIYSAWYSKCDYMKSELKIAYLMDSYDSLNNKVDWALFGGHKTFRLNPPIQVGKMRSLLLSGGISTITKTTRASEGWSAFGSVEFAKKSWSSEFEFDQYILDVRRFQPLGKYENFNVRIRIGTSCGKLPLQKAYELGGLGTMNAFPFKSDIGNRMLLLNAEFILNGNILDDLNFWPTWIFQHVNIILLTDAGFTRSILSSASATEGFGGIKLSDFHHDFGLALGNKTGSVRIGFAWRTDHSAPVQFLLRFNRPF